MKNERRKEIEVGSLGTRMAIGTSILLGASDDGRREVERFSVGLRARRTLERMQLGDWGGWRGGR